MGTAIRSRSLSKAGARRRLAPLLLFGMAMAFFLNASGFCASSPSAKPASGSQESLAPIRRLLQEEKFAEAEKESRALLARAESAHGKDSVEAAKAMDLVVEALIGLGKMGEPEARTLADRAVEIVEKRRGAESLEVADALAVSGKLRFFAGDYPGARTVCERAAAIQEKTPPRDELDRVPALDCLGITYSRTGPLDHARQVLERAIGIQEKALGPQDLALAKPVNHLGIVTAMMGEYDKAFPLLQRSIEILEKNFGPDYAGIGPPLSNLGMMYKLTGDYAAAVPVLERALKIRTQALGPDHFEVGITNEVLGNLQVALADYARAETYLRRALEVFERSVPSHGEVGAVLGSLGGLMAQQDRMTEALPLLQRSAQVLEKAYGPGNPETIGSMIALASVYQKLGQLEPAGDLYRKALALQGKDLGPEHPDRAVAYQGFGSYLLATGDFQQAREVLGKALAIHEKVFGGDGFQVSETLESLAVAQWALGDVKTAFATSLRSEASIRRHLLRTSPVLSERQALRYESRLGGGISTAASILASRPEMGASPELVARLWDEVVRSRAVVLDEIARRHQAVLQLEDPATTRLSADLAKARSRLSHLSLLGPDKKQPDRYHLDLERSEAEVEALERDLAGKSRVYREETAARLAGWEDARKSLPAGAALVAYLRFDRAQVPGKVGNPSGRGPVTTTPNYAVLTLKAGEPGPRFALLGPASEIDDRIAAWRKEILNPGSTRADKAFRAASAELTRRIWEPVAPRLQGARLVFLVPDSTLNLVSFATLSLPGNRFLIEEEAKLHYLSSERDLVQSPKAPRRTTTALVLGGPDFDSTGSEDMADAAPRAPASLPATRASATYRSSVPSCEAFRTLRFQPLPGSVAEADEVSALLSRSTSSSPAPGEIVKLTGRSASEQSLKDMSAGRAILHVATHGFFLSRDCLVPGATEGRGASPGSSFLDNPLLFSGLAMAGANLRLGGSTMPEKEDGILTAAEVASLDLRGVEWAVLSACETGLGTIQVGEGVLGLRRAFQIAGARTLIMSLWSVSDVPAREWIRNLYASRTSGATSADAVRDATLKMLQARRKAGVSTHPSSWGAFIASGDWE